LGAEDGGRGFYFVEGAEDERPRIIVGCGLWLGAEDGRARIMVGYKV
jgi:hypothetical protein